MRTKRITQLWLITIAMIAILALSAAPSYAATVYDTAISYWGFNDGTARDDAGTNNGTVMGATYNSNGAVGGAYTFNDGAYIVMNSAPNLGSGNFTLAFWANIPSSDDGEGQDMITWASDGSSPIFIEVTSDSWVDPGGRIIVQGMNTWRDLGGTKQIWDDSWHFLAITRSGDTATLYIDNTIDATWGVSGAISNENPLYLGVRHYDDEEVGNVYGMNGGSLDEVAIWSSALSANEIDALYKTGFISSAMSTLSLGYTTDQMNQLAYLYQQQSGYVDINGVRWTYTNYETGSMGYAGTNVNGHDYYIHLGSGLYGDPLGGEGVPEPATVVGLFSALFMLASRRVLKRIQL